MEDEDLDRLVKVFHPMCDIDHNKGTQRSTMSNSRESPDNECGLQKGHVRNIDCFVHRMRRLSARYPIARFLSLGAVKKSLYEGNTWVKRP